MIRTRLRRPSAVSHFEHFEDLRQDYGAAKSSRYRRKRTGIAPGGSHADYHYRDDADYLRVMEYARAMERDDVLISRLLDAATDATLLHGIDIEPRTGSRDLDAALQARWWNWAEDPEACDAAGEQTFYQMQKLAWRQTLLDGDIVALLTEEGSIWHVEAHRIRTPQSIAKSKTRNVVHGVQLDGRRRRVAYWVTKEDLDPQQPLKRIDETTQYRVRDDDGMRILLHLYKPHRFSQTRGVSGLAPIFDAAGMYEDIQFAMLVKEQVGACYSILHNRGENWQPGPGSQGPASDGGYSDDPDCPTTAGRTEQPVAPGMHYYSERGEDLQGFSPNVPSQNYFPHMKMTLQTISVNLGVPLIIALMDGSETNFSGGRMAVDAAKNGWRDNQLRVCVHYVRPTYRWKVQHFLAADPELAALAAQPGDDGRPVNVYGYHEHLPVWPYIQPLQDASTDVLRLRHKLISPQRLAAERNQNADEIRTEIIKHNADAIKEAMKAADEINAGKSDPAERVSWRDLYQMAPPEGVNVSINATPGNDNGGGKPNAA